MADRSNLIWQIFQAIENNDDGSTFWNLLEQLKAFDDGIIYMTYGGETPQSSAEKLNRQYLLKLIQIHQKLASIRAQY